jgi:hypothetical protein
MAKAKPNQKIHVDKLQTASTKLEQLEEKPKSELTLRESIYFLKDKLESGLKKGYDYQDLSSILEEQGILVSAATLKQYLTDIGKKSGSRRKNTKSSPKANQKKSTNNTSNSSKSASSSKDTATGSSLELKSTKQAVKLDSSSANKSALDASQKASKKDQQLRSKKSTLAESKVLSGSNDDLSEDFNRY